MFFRSERLFLRPGWPEDRDALLRAIADEGIVTNLASAPWPFLARDAQDAAARPQNPRFPHFFVTRPDRAAGSELVGSVGLGARADGSGVAPELGYWIARDHWGKGYATEAGRAVLTIARTLGHRRVTASHFIDNPASGRVLAKLGFRPTGAIDQRRSRARGASAAAVVHAIDLAAGGDYGGDGDGEGSAVAMPRAA